MAQVRLGLALFYLGFVSQSWSRLRAWVSRCGWNHSGLKCCHSVLGTVGFRNALRRRGDLPRGLVPGRPARRALMATASTEDGMVIKRPEL